MSTWEEGSARRRLSNITERTEPTPAWPPRSNSLTPSPVDDTRNAEGHRAQQDTTGQIPHHFPPWYQTRDTRGPHASPYYSGTSASPRSDFPSYGSYDRGHSSPERGHSSFYTGPDDHTRGRSRRRRNSSPNSRNAARSYHQPEVIIQSHPLPQNAPFVPVNPQSQHVPTFLSREPPVVFSQDRSPTPPSSRSTRRYWRRHSSGSPSYPYQRGEPPIIPFVPLDRSRIDIDPPVIPIPLRRQSSSSSSNSEDSHRRTRRYHRRHSSPVYASYSPGRFANYSPPHAGNEPGAYSSYAHSAYPYPRDSRPEYSRSPRRHRRSRSRSYSPHREAHYPPPPVAVYEPNSYYPDVHSTQYPSGPAPPVVIIPATRYEPPFVAVNPFGASPPRPGSPVTYYTANTSSSGHEHDRPSAESPPHPRSSGSRLSNSPPPSLPVLGPIIVMSHRRRTRRSWRHRLKHSLIFLLALVFVKLPRLIYINLLLRLPLLYFSRVTRLFEDANLSLPDIRRMAVANADQWKDGTPGALMTAWLPNDATVSPHLLNFRHSWEGFIDALLREWKTQNVVSALMLSAILTMLQIDAAAADPIARTTALLSLISALMSLLFGSMYIVRFGTMRKMYKAATWADEAQRGRTSILWNVWIMLAIPAVWLAWSIILFVTCIMAFTWRTGAADSSAASALSDNAARGLRIGVSAVLAVALIYLFLVVKTFRKYGDAMDKRWSEKVFSWAQEGRYGQIGAYPGAWQPSPLASRSISRSSPPYPSHSESPRPAPYTHYPMPGSRAHHGRESERSRDVPIVLPSPPVSFDRPFTPLQHPSIPFHAIKVMNLRYHGSGSVRTPPSLMEVLRERRILLEEWLRFTAVGPPRKILK
ncbi:hypothetical protein DFH07DRAFT_252722 [Mycena maculata]|uniref:Uncharacterized protein n=1 Tax=Mycena maculata TaxID=230809 RepID=A0AAD7HPM1_9AGAR|nr:hypothetical protein DFH07DRAFT_252722 [Mycena maculata]